VSVWVRTPRVARGDNGRLVSVLKTHPRPSAASELGLCQSRRAADCMLHASLVLLPPLVILGISTRQDTFKVQEMMKGWQVESWLEQREWLRAEPPVGKQARAVRATDLSFCSVIESETTDHIYKDKKKERKRKKEVC